MNSKHIILLVAGLLSLPSMVWAQDDIDEEATTAPKVRKAVRKPQYAMKSLRGIVLDQGTKAPIAGVQVRTLGNVNYTAMTDETGTFTIKVPVFTTALYVHSPEYLPLQVAVSADTSKVMTIRLLSDRYQNMYTDGTGISAGKSFVSSHTTGVSIDEEIGQKLGADVRAIQHSGAPSMGTSLFIRGLNSINADAQPLIIVDGLEMDMQRTRTALHSGQFLNMLANISPDDIDKVEVLKNATALYGARGANGVIIITTKRGHSMATRIDANISVGVTTIPNLPTMMDASQYRTYAMEMLGTMSGANALASYKFLNDDPSGYYYHVYHNNTDWNDYTYRRAMTQNYSINVQGGDEIGMYNLSVGYMEAASTVKKNDFNRMNVRFNTDMTIMRNLTNRFDISISRTANNVFDDGISSDLSGSTITSPTFLAAIKSPLVSAYQYNQIIGGFSSLLSDADDIFSQLGSNYSLANPVAILENGYGDNMNHAENTFFNARLEPTYHFNDDLSVTETFSYSLNRNSQRYFRPYNGVPSYEIAELGTVTSMVGSLFSKETNVVSDTRLNYQHQWAAHTLKAYAGFRYNYFAYDANNLSTQYTSETNDKNPSLSASNGYQSTVGVDDVWKNMQMYANADYNYANKYFASFTLTGEANSRFGKHASGLSLLGVKWAIFPSIQLGWVLTNESWFPRTSGINYLRVNAGFDISGNDNISNYAARTTLSSVVFNYNAIGLKLTNIGNDEIQWESTKKYNVGLQGYFLNNRLGINMDFYIHKTDNLLTLKTFDNPIGGVNRYWSNGGALKNTGFEISVTGKPIVSRDWNLELGASVGHYKNKVTMLADGDYTTSVYGDNNILTSVGNPVALFYGYETAGVFSTDAEAKQAGNGTYLYMTDDAGNVHEFKAGDVHFVDRNNDGIISTADKTVIGDPNPDIYGNLFATLSWKRLTLNALFNYSLGNDVYNYERSILNSGSTFYNQQVATMSHWRYEGQVTDMPKLSYGDTMGNNRFSDRWIENGSYLRLKSLRLNYQVPVPGKWNWLQGLNVWLEANNLVTITKYKGNDPEFSAANGVLYQGIDAGNLPQSRTFTMGLKINL